MCWWWHLIPQTCYLQYLVLTDTLDEKFAVIRWKGGGNIEQLTWFFYRYWTVKLLVFKFFWAKRKELEWEVVLMSRELDKKGHIWTRTYMLTHNFWKKKMFQLKQTKVILYVENCPRLYHKQENPLGTLNQAPSEMDQENKISAPRSTSKQ